MIEIDR